MKFSFVSVTLARWCNALIILYWDYKLIFFTGLCNVQFMAGNTELRNKPLVHEHKIWEI